MKIGQLLLVFIIVVLCFKQVTFAKENRVSAKVALCPASLPEEACNLYLEALKSALEKNPSDINDLKDNLAQTIKQASKTPEFLNSLLASPALKSKLDSVPVELAVKLIDRKAADSVLALEFSYSTSFSDLIYDTSGSRQHGYQVNFNLNGTATQNKEENPQNFIDAKLSISGSNYPSFNLLEAKAGLVPSYCTDVEHIDDKECALLLALDQEEYFAPLKSTYYFDYGVDIGIETDQSFDTNNKTIGAFVFVAYEDFSRNTFMGLHNIKPALRLAIDGVDPNTKTARAIAGDNTSYQRLSGEISVVVPLIKLADLPYTLTYNFRVYRELNASQIVKDANLESYVLRTYSLNTPTGLFISYASGRLPFGLEDENSIELGFKTFW